MIALKDHQLRVLDSSRDFFRITSRTAHSEEAFRQITERTFGTAWSYLSARVAGVEPDPVVIQKLKSSLQKLADFMKSQGLACKPEEVPHLKGDDARSAFINHFKEVQRLKTQLDQYTDLSEENQATIEQVLPKEQLTAFRGVYLETAQAHGAARHRQDLRAGEKHHHLQSGAHEYAAARGEGFGV